MFLLLLILALLVLCITRLRTGVLYQSKAVHNGAARKVPVYPYWVPWIGHLFSLLVKPNGFMLKCSNQSSHGIFSIYVLGTLQNVVSSPSLIEMVLEKCGDPSVLDSNDWFLLNKAFGANKKYLQTYLTARNDADACSDSSSPRASGSPAASERIIKSVQECTPNLVSFSKSVVDQSLWERTSFPTIVPSEGGLGANAESVEVSLFPLIRNFVGYARTTSLMGTEFVEYYPGVLDDMWEFDSGLKFVLLGLPRWFPIRSLTKSHLARMRLKNAMSRFHRALEQNATGDELEAPWNDLGDVSPFMKARSEVWRAHSIPLELKSLWDLSVIWALNSESNTLVFWMLVRLWATVGLVEQVRDEIAPFAIAFQPPQEFGTPEPPRIDILPKELSRSCPLLNACYQECLRLDWRPTLVKTVKKDFTLIETREDVLPGVEPQTYVLEAGSSLVIPFNILQQDTYFFESPASFRPERFFISSDEEMGNRAAQFQKLRVSIEGQSATVRQSAVEEEVLALVAGILALWDIEPTDPAGWRVPKHLDSIGVALPSSDIRVRLRRRRLN